MHILGATKPITSDSSGTAPTFLYAQLAHDSVTHDASVPVADEAALPDWLIAVVPDVGAQVRQQDVLQPRVEVIIRHHLRVGNVRQHGVVV